VAASKRLDAVPTDYVNLHSTTHLQSASAAGNSLPDCFKRLPLMTAE
jgi:hypothetical protein